MNTINEQRLNNCLDAAEWTNRTAASVMLVVSQTCQEQGFCSVMLTGGRSAELLYEAWANLPEFSLMRNVHFYFGDERCVPPDHPESNFGLAMRTLFVRGMPENCTVTRMAADQPDHEAAAIAYEQLLPDRLDVVLLSMGLDGHIASIFPHSIALNEINRRVVAINGLKPPYERMTITPTVIRSAQQVIVMALGSEKRRVYEQAQCNPVDIDTLPVRLVLDRTWVFGEPRCME